MSPDQLAAVMTRFGLLQIDMALIFGVTPRTVNNWYHGRQPIPRPVGMVLKALDENLIPIEWIAANIPADATPSQTEAH